MVDGVQLKRVGDEYAVIEFYKIDLEKGGGVSKCCDHRLVSISSMLQIVRLRLYVYVIPACPPPPPPLIHSPQFVCDPTETLTASGGMCSFNHERPAHQWKAYPLPNDTSSNFFRAVILCQEIYCILDLSIPQVFCRGSRKWIPLDPPPRYHKLHQFQLISKSFADDANGRIFIFHRDMGEDTRLGDIYAWYPNCHLARKSSGPGTEEWECVASDFPQWSHLTTFEDGVFYFHHHKAPPYFSTYHVNSKQWLDVEWSSPFTYELTEMKTYVDMKHMGNGKLCLLAHRKLYPDNDFRIHGSRIYVVSFQYELSHNTPLVTFRHISTKLYDLPGVRNANNLLPV